MGNVQVNEIKLYWGMFAKWVGDAVNFCGISQAELARRMAAKLRRGIDAAAVNKIVSGKRALAADEMLAVAEITNYPLLISLEGRQLDKQEPQHINEAYLMKLVSFALEWRGLPEDMSRNLSAALLSASRKQVGHEGIELTDDQLRRIALALAEALGLPRPQE